MKCILIFKKKTHTIYLNNIYGPQYSMQAAFQCWQRCAQKEPDETFEWLLSTSASSASVGLSTFQVPVMV